MIIPDQHQCINNVFGELRKLGLDVSQTTVAKYLGHRPAVTDLARVPEHAVPTENSVHIVAIELAGLR